MARNIFVENKMKYTGHFLNLGSLYASIKLFLVSSIFVTSLVGLVIFFFNFGEAGTIFLLVNIEIVLFFVASVLIFAVSLIAPFLTTLEADSQGITIEDIQLSRKFKYRYTVPYSDISKIQMLWRGRIIKIKYKYADSESMIISNHENFLEVIKKCAPDKLEVKE